MSYCVDTAPKPLQLLCYPDKSASVTGARAAGGVRPRRRISDLLYYCTIVEEFDTDLGYPKLGNRTVAFEF